MNLVQDASGTTAADTDTSVTASFGAGPTQGNLLVSTFFTRGATATNPSGYVTQIELIDVGHDDRMRIASKIAGASEPSAVTYTGLDGTAHAAEGIFEVSGNATPETADKTGSTGVTAGVTSLSSGSTGTLSQADEVVIAAWSLRGDNAGAAVDSGFTLKHVMAPGVPGTFNGLMDAIKFVASNAAQASTASWTTAQDAMGAIASFKAAATAAALRSRGLPRGLARGLAR